MGTLEEWMALNFIRTMGVREFDSTRGGHRELPREELPVTDRKARKLLNKTNPTVSF